LKTTESGWRGPSRPLKRAPPERVGEPVGVGAFARTETGPYHQRRHPSGEGRAGRGRGMSELTTLPESGAHHARLHPHMEGAPHQSPPPISEGRVASSGTCLVPPTPKVGQATQHTSVDSPCYAISMPGRPMRFNWEYVHLKNSMLREICGFPGVFSRNPGKKTVTHAERFFSLARHIADRYLCAKSSLKPR